MTVMQFHKLILLLTERNNLKLIPVHGYLKFFYCKFSCYIIMLICFFLYIYKYLILLTIYNYSKNDKQRSWYTLIGATIVTAERMKKRS